MIRTGKECLDSITGSAQNLDTALNVSVDAARQNTPGATSSNVRVDWCDSEPIAMLEAIWRRYAPQAEHHVLRAIGPMRAPEFDVPGDP